MVTHHSALSACTNQPFPTHETDPNTCPGSHHAPRLQGSFDKTAAVCDVRATAADWKAAGKWSVTSDVECVTWDLHNPHQFLVSTDNGTVTCHDARKAGEGPIFTIGAHTEACTGLAVNPLEPGLLATSSLDRTIKLWDTRGNKVDYIASRTMEVRVVLR